MTNLHYIEDEQLGGVEREYAEVERKANVGDYVVNKCDEHCHAYILEVGYVQDSGNLNGSNALNDNDWTSHYLYANKYATLDPTGNVRIDGKVYRMVDRNADVGEKVLTLNYGDVDAVAGDIHAVEAAEYDDGSISTEEGAFFDTEEGDKYVVLEPVEHIDDLTLTESDVRDNPRQVIDLIANMAGRLTKLESKVSRLGTANEKAYNIVSRNVEVWAQEVETLKYGVEEALNRVAHVEADLEETPQGMIVKISEATAKSALKIADAMEELKRTALTAEERREL
jgi:hypothetical protein